MHDIITIRVDAEIKKAAQGRAKRQGRSLSGHARWLLLRDLGLDGEEIRAAEPVLR